MALVAVTEGIDFDIESLVVPNHEPALLGDYLEDIDLDSPLWSTMSYLREKEERDIAAGKGLRMQIFQPDSTKIATLTRGYAKIRSTDPTPQHPTEPTLTRKIPPIEHATTEGQP